MRLGTQDPPPVLEVPHGLLLDFLSALAGKYAETRKGDPEVKEGTWRCKAVCYSHTLSFVGHSQMAVLEATLQTSIVPCLGFREEGLWEAWTTLSGVRVGCGWSVQGCRRCGSGLGVLGWSL